MNKIAFDIQHSEFGNLVVPVVDGESLISILRKFEITIAKKEGHSKLAGAYAGLPISLVVRHQNIILGKAKEKGLTEKLRFLIVNVFAADVGHLLRK